MIQDDEIRALLQKYATGRLTSEEKAMLESWYIQQASRKDVFIDERLMEQNLQQMAGRLPVKHVAVLHTLWPKIAAAAAILLIIGWWLFSNDHRSAQKPALAATNTKQLITPGKNGALLTLADGRQIVLDSVDNGVVATQNGAAVLLKNGTVVYNATRSPRTTGRSPSYNTLVTPRGRQFQIVLPDGTKVWLNAASSIRYPTAFTGNERRVELTGEGYFEVTKNKNMPFRVFTPPHPGGAGGAMVEVLGTHFNIMAYDDEPAVKTTLLEGKVRVEATPSQTTNPKQQAILHPGEQATVSDQIKVAPVKTAVYVAWKNGEFMFRNEPLENIMRSVARWYDVEIVYKADVAHKEVWGSITKYGNVADVLEMIALTGVAHFKIEGRTIIVLS
jgi:ferric-dicitrate binding protein FerR (iron transport regulator)